MFLLLYIEKVKLNLCYLFYNFQLQSDADRKADRERRELEARMNHRVEHLQAKISTLTVQNSDVTEKRHHAESTVK